MAGKDLTGKGLLMEAHTTREGCVVRVFIRGTDMPNSDSIHRLTRHIKGRRSNCKIAANPRTKREVEKGMNRILLLEVRTRWQNRRQAENAFYQALAGVRITARDDGKRRQPAPAKAGDRRWSKRRDRRTANAQAT